MTKDTKIDNKLLVHQEELITAFDNETDLLLFYLAWLKNGLNAASAYKELHPHVTDGSAKVLGSRWLARVNPRAVLATFDLDIEVYMQQLKDGLKATKTVNALVMVSKNGSVVRKEDVGVIEVDDHQTRKPYHDKLGKLLGLETDKNTMSSEIKDGDKTVRFIITRGENPVSEVIVPSQEE